MISRFARRRGLFDHISSSRKIHAARVPRLGGLAIVAGFYAPLLALILYPTGLGGTFYSEGPRAFAFLFGGLAIAALGLFDDIFGAGAVEKFFVQIAVALYVWWAGFRIEDINLVGGTIVSLGWFSVVFTVAWIVGVMNALNLIDGLDGLAAGIALISAVANFFIAFSTEPLMCLWMAALAGALIAFLRFNFNPASIFMGDGGSLFLGYVLAVAAIRTSQKSSAAVSLLVPIVALALPIGDTLLAMVRRGIRARPLFSGDKEHIHHRLLALGLSHRQVVLVLYGVCAILGVISVGLVSVATKVGIAALIALVAFSLVGLWRLGFFRFQDTSEVLELRRRNLELRGAVRTITTKLRRAKSVDRIVAVMQDVAPALNATEVRLDLPGAFVHPRRHPTRSEGTVHALSAPLSARFPVDPGFGHIEVEWPQGDREPDRDHEIAAERVCRALSRALERTLCRTPSFVSSAPAELVTAELRPPWTGTRRN